MDASVPGPLRKWDGDCYIGSSAAAIDAVARANGYVTVDVEPGFDLFLVAGQPLRYSKG